MSLRHLSFLAAFLACAPVLHAVRPRPADPADTDAPVKAVAKADVSSKADASAKTEAVPPYELKNRSAFTAPADVPRAPFWPIGWVKHVAGAPVAPVQEVQVAPKILLDEKSFTLTSILLSTGTTPSLAVINHRAYSEGEFMRMPKTPGAPPLRIRVQRITDGVVTLQNGSQTLAIPLQRMELSTKRPDEALLDQDR